MCDVVNSTFPDRSAFGAFGQYVRPRMPPGTDGSNPSRIVTETGSGASVVSDKISTWLRSAPCYTAENRAFMDAQ